MSTPSEISSPVAATADWPWSTSPRDPAATVLEWYLHADFAHAQDAFRLAVLTGMLPHRLDSWSGVARRPWLEVVDAMIESTRQGEPPRQSDATLQRDRTGRVTGIPGEAALAWPEGEPAASYHRHMNWFAALQRRLVGMCRADDALTAVFDDVGHTFGDDGGARMLALSLAEAIQAAAPASNGLDAAPGWPWRASSPPRTMLEWLLNTDLTEPQEVFRVTVLTGRLHHRLPYRPCWDRLTSNRPWLDTLDAIVESARGSDGSAASGRTLERNERGKVTYVPGEEALIWARGKPPSYGFLNWYGTLQRWVKEACGQRDEPPAAKLLADVDRGFGDDEGVHLISACIAEALLRHS